MPMMVVTSGSRCDLLPSCCHAPPFYGLQGHGRLKESREGRKGWCMSKEIIKISSLVGTRIGPKNLLKFKFERNTSFIIGSCYNVTGPELYTPFRKVSDIRNPRGKLGKRNHARTEKSWSRVYAKEVSREIYEEESVDRGSLAKQINPIERASKGVSSLTVGEANEQGSSRLSNQRHGEIFWDGVSKSEYQKIQDLKFSGDIWEGDSGPQVLDLQVAKLCRILADVRSYAAQDLDPYLDQDRRMLFRLGYLSKRSELTAYFGLETKRALQQFQISNGVLGTGAWGSSSRQALWKLLSEDRSSCSKGGSSMYSDLQQSVSSSMENDDAGGTDIGIRVSELMSNMGAHSQEFISTLSSAPYWRHLPTNVPRSAALFGLLVGMLVALFGLGYSLVGFFHEQHHGQPVRRRVLRAHWRDDLSGTTSTKPRRHLHMFPGLDLPLVGEEDFKYRLRSKSNSSSIDGSGRTDRLILYEGQVLVGDETPSHALPFMSGPASRRSSGKFASRTPSRVKSSSNADLASTDQKSKKLASNGSSSGQRESQLYRPERNSKLGGKGWQEKDEENSKDRVEELRKAVQSTEKNRQEAMRALAEERQRSLELQVKISRQKETAAALEEEVRVLKESHDALLTSLRKKYSSTVAARAAAALLYQNWDTNYEEGSPQTLSF